MLQELERLKGENERLRVLAERDSLTGLYNHGAVMEKIEAALAVGVDGVLLMLDVDGFKAVNDQYGHLTGDRLLESMGQTLCYLFYKNDILGRAGGDEFVAFLPGGHGTEFVNSKAEQVRVKLAQAGRRAGLADGLSVTIGAAFTRPGDDFQSLFSRADQAMLGGKGRPADPIHYYREGKPAERRPGPAGAERFADMVHIRGQLRELEVEPGAYCQDYDTFLRIYRFVERGLGRSGSEVYLLLLSLTDGAGGFLALDGREELVGALHEAIQHSLRRSDLFTRYSSCQFLVMLPGADRDSTGLIGRRIEDALRARVAPGVRVGLQQELYPLLPAGM